MCLGFGGWLLLYGGFFGGCGDLVFGFCIFFLVFLLKSIVVCWGYLGIG